MKKLTILLFSILISFSSYGEWVVVGHNTRGDTLYIETDTIKPHGGYVYFWALLDYIKPNKDGDLSVKMYAQGDCGVNRFKHLSIIWYEQSMGNGVSVKVNPSDKWEYPLPDDASGRFLDYACK